MRLTDVTPHMHFLGREFISIATLPDGSERPLIRIADWDFRWQNTFTYREPVHLPAGSRIDTWVRYDNSADNPQNPALEPRTVTWGWETTDEMSELWIGFVPDTPADRERIVRASERSWYRPAHVSDAEIARVLAHPEPGLIVLARFDSARIKMGAWIEGVSYCSVAGNRTRVCSREAVSTALAG